MPRMKNKDMYHLKNEVDLLRAVMQRVVDGMDGELAFKDLVRALDIISIASTRLASLLKTEQSLEQQPDEGRTEQINQAMAELLEELKAERE